MHDLTALLNETSAIVWAFDTEGICTLSQGGGLRLLGFEPGQFEGIDLLETYPETEEPGQLIRWTLQGNATTRDYEREPGAWVQTSYRPIYDEAGTLLGGIAITVDVTHRRAREEEGNRAALVAQITRELTEAAPAGPAAVAEAIAHGVATALGDVALVLQVGGDADITGTLGLAGADMELVEAVGEAAPLWLSLHGWSETEDLSVDPHPIYLDEIPDEFVQLMRERLGDALTDRLNVGRLAIVPLSEQGVLNGLIIVVRRQGARGFTDLERELLNDVAGRAGLSLANARLLDTAQRLMADRRALLGHLIDAEEAERKRLAHDIHDDTIQVLAAVDLRLQLLRRKVLDKPDCAAELEVLDALRESTQAATSRLRRLLFELQPPALERAGVAMALRQLAEDVFEASGTRIVVADHTVDQPDPGSAVVLFRVGKEALVNARKHAQATTVVVTLETHEEGTRLTVTDDGVGLPEGTARTDVWPHLGLETMRDRTQVAGGEFSIRRGATSGTVVEAWIPGTNHEHG